MKRKHPVGVRWQFTADNGDHGEVWLADRHQNDREVWLWEFHHKDGSGAKRDWMPSKDQAVWECRSNFFYNKYNIPIVRFTRTTDRSIS